MTIYYAKALFIYFWKPVAAISCLVGLAIVTDLLTRYKRQQLQIVIQDGGLEVLKWVGVGLMVVDHANKFLLEGGNAVAFNAGRIVMPIFAFVFAYNLARLQNIPMRIFWRLFLFGSLACVPLFLLQPLKDWLPLNVLFMLLLGATIIQTINRGRWWLIASCLLFVVGGAFVEYWWPALAIVVGSYYFFKNRSVVALTIIILGLFYLYNINHNYWAFLSLPLIVSASFLKLNVKRNKWFFYAFYPLHLMAIYAISVLGR